MRSSLVPLAVSAGVLLALAASGAAPAKAAGGGRARPEANGARGPAAPQPEAGDAHDASPRPTPLDREEGRLVLGRSYEDVFLALRDDNPCSRFFGGPRLAVTVFNEFARRLRRKMLGADNVGLIMSGDYTSYRDGATGASYRLFDEATINTNGPFVVVPQPAGARFQVGRFPAASRAGKALMLLHELGHLIRGPDGWLLPNDGDAAELSDRNTRTVESRCLEQLLALH